MKRMKASGFTLLELLISVALGGLIAAAAVQLFTTNATGFTLMRGLSDVQDNGSFAVDFINRDVRQAGLRPAGLGAGFVPVIMDVAQMPGATPNLLTGDGVAALGIGNSDRLVVQRLAPVATVDCEGNAVAAGSYVVSRYFLRADDASGSASALACDGGSHNGVVANGLGDNGVVLLTSVENMQIQLGVGDAGVPVRYFTAAQYNALAAPRPRIITVRVGVMVGALESAGANLAEQRDMRVLDEDIAGAAIPRDGRIRRVFVTSIALRNEF